MGGEKQGGVEVFIIIIIIINYLTSPAGHLAGDPLPPEG